MFKKIINTVAVCLLAVTLCSCASNAVAKKAPATIKKYEDAMFWEINSTDKNGAPSKLYVLGTIHVGDDNLYPLPEAVEQAYINADKLVGEISSDDNKKIVNETVTRQMASMQREAARVEETGKKLSEYLTDDQKKLVTALLGGPQGLAQMELFEPWVLSTALTTIPIVYSGYDPTKGYDSYLTTRSASEGRTVEGLDTLEVQFEIIEFGDWETQLEMLKETLDALIENQADPGKDLKDIYNAYLTADVKVVSDVMEAQLAEDTSDFGDEYNNLLFTKRNTDWATKFANYLNEGGTTFIFAGCGHFVGPDSVFEIMANNGTLDY